MSITSCMWNTNRSLLTVRMLLRTWCRRQTVEEDNLGLPITQLRGLHLLKVSPSDPTVVVAMGESNLGLQIMQLRGSHLLKVGLLDPKVLFKVRWSKGATMACW